MSDMEMKFIERPSKPQKKKKSHKKGLTWLIIVVSILVLALICGMVSYKYVLSNTNIQASEIVIDKSDAIEVEIPLGAGTSDIIKVLKDKGIIHHPTLFKLISRINGVDAYQAGTHILSKKLSYTQIMAILADKPVARPSVRITIPEGWNNKQLEDYLAGKNLIDRVKFEDAINNDTFEYKFFNSVPKRQRRLEGYLFPETYDVEMKTPEKDIVNILLRQFNKVFKPEYYQQAKSLGMTPDQIIVMASMVEREAKSQDERARIAGVFYNRMKSKDKTLHKLQSCATVQYVFYYKDGIMKDSISDADTKIDDPYNTYMYEELPPGPICNPGEASIKAALNPEQTDYLYFVAKEDGTGEHYFAKTFKEHLNNQAKAAKNKKQH